MTKKHSQTSDEPVCDPGPADKTLLESWKEIAAHIQRDVRTARRWEKHEGLPVHRHLHKSRSSVYAYPSELDAWWANREPEAPLKRSPWLRPVRAFASATALAMALMTVASGPQMEITNAQAAERPTPSIRMVWSGLNAGYENAPSPDGRYLSFVDWDTGDLAVHDLTTGESRRLTNKGTWQQSSEFALESRWSPDGSMIAYDWYTPQGDSSLRIIDPAGGEPRVLHQPESDGIATEVADWSPDGRKILVYGYQTRSPGPQWIGTVDVADGKIEKIKEGKITQFSPASFSPDGEYILTNRETEAGNSDVILLSADGQRAIPVVTHPAYDRAIGWHPGGDWILFASDRTGTPALWAVRFANGQVQGEPTMLSANLPGDSPVGFTRSGALFMSRGRRATDIYEAEVDPDTGRVISPPAKMALRYEGVNGEPNYSLDGTKLAYVSTRGTVARIQNQRDTLCILDLKTGKTRDFVTGFRQLYNPLWLSGNSGLIVPAQKTREDIGLYRFDMETGSFSLMKEFRYDDLFYHNVAPDGKTLYYVFTDREKDVTEIVARDLETGTERVLHSVTPMEYLWTALSPDGTQLAYLNRADDHVIRVIPMSGGEPRDAVHYRQSGNFVIQFTWSADGRYFLVPRIDDPEPPPVWSVWRFRVSDGQGQKILSNSGRATKITVHPDGRHIAFASPGTETPAGELWVIEDYLPGNPE